MSNGNLKQIGSKPICKRVLSDYLYGGKNLNLTEEEKEAYKVIENSEEFKTYFVNSGLYEYVDFLTIYNFTANAKYDEAGYILSVIDAYISVNMQEECDEELSKSEVKPFPYTLPYETEEDITETANTFQIPEYSDWKCYLFGGDECNGMIYRPIKNKHPNIFVRFMSKVFLGCTWVKE